MAVLSKIPKIDEGEAHGRLPSGILTTGDLLRLGKKTAPELIAAGSGIGETRILLLFHIVDLARIEGIGWEYAETSTGWGLTRWPPFLSRTRTD